MEMKPRILVVDDENTIRASFDRVLSENGCLVRTAPDGRSALERLRGEPYDVAFVDLRMPVMDGMEVVRTIRTAQPLVQVVIVTGYGTEESQKEAAALGVYEFVSKPVTPEQLNSLATRAWESRAKAPPAVAPAPQPAAVPQAAPAPPPAPAPMSAPSQEETASIPKMLLLLARAALLGLGYVVFLPFIGLAMLAWAVWRRLRAGVRGAKSE